MNFNSTSHNFTSGRFIFRESYPSFTDPDSWAFLVTGVYLVLFVFGMCGNASTATLIHSWGGLSGLVCVRRTHCRAHDSRTTSKLNGNHSGASGTGKLMAPTATSILPTYNKTLPRHTDYLFIYLLALCIVDMIVLMSLPTAMVDSFIGVWIFGSAFCKLHQFCSTIGRLASAFLICAMTVNHCYSTKRNFDMHNRNSDPTRTLSTIDLDQYGEFLPNISMKNNKNYFNGPYSGVISLVISLSLVAIAFVFLIPLLIYVQPQKVLLFDSVREGVKNNVNITVVIQYRIYKCIDAMPMNVLLWFTGTTFVIGYFLTFAIFIGTNCYLITLLRRGIGSPTFTKTKSIKRISAYIVMIGMLYYISWAPYWSSVLYVSYVDLFESRSIKTLENGAQHTMFLVYLAHIFSFMNAATNWLLYSRMIMHLNGGDSRHRLYAANNIFFASQAPPISETFCQQSFLRNGRSSFDLEYYDINQSRSHDLIEKIGDERRMSGLNNTRVFRSSIRGSRSVEGIHLLA